MSSNAHAITSAIGNPITIAARSIGRPNSECRRPEKPARCLGRGPNRRPRRRPQPCKRCAVAARQEVLRIHPPLLLCRTVNLSSEAQRYSPVALTSWSRSRSPGYASDSSPGDRRRHLHFRPVVPEPTTADEDVHWGRPLSHLIIETAARRAHLAGPFVPRGSGLKSAPARTCGSRSMSLIVAPALARLYFGDKGSCQRVCCWPVSVATGHGGRSCATSGGIRTKYPESPIAVNCRSRCFAHPESFPARFAISIRSCQARDKTPSRSQETRHRCAHNPMVCNRSAIDTQGRSKNYRDPGPAYD